MISLYLLYSGVVKETFLPSASTPFESLWYSSFKSDRVEVFSDTFAKAFFNELANACPSCIAFSVAFDISLILLIINDMPFAIAANTIILRAAESAFVAIVASLDAPAVAFNPACICCCSAVNACADPVAPFV